MSRPVTRSYAKAHNNVVSELPVMGDTDSLASKLEAFMQHMTIRQQALEEQMEMLSTHVREVGKDSGNRGRGSTSGNRDSHGPEERRHQGPTDITEATNRGPMVPRNSKLEFPSFDGSEDPLVWLRRCEQFFGNQRIPEEERMGLAAFHLTGEAQLWFYQVEQEEAGLG